MSSNSLIRNSFAVLFTLTLSGAAFARQPAALERSQEEAARAIASCPSVPATAGNGYRDMLVRFGDAGSAETVSAVVATKVAAGHRVASCEGTIVHASSGYRDMLDRVPAREAQVLIARAR